MAQAGIKRKNELYSELIALVYLLHNDINSLSQKTLASHRYRTSWHLSQRASFSGAEAKHGKLQRCGRSLGKRTEA